MDVTCPPRFTVLASGGAGNACLLESDGSGLLIDIGLGPRQLAARLALAGRSWQNIHGALLTHTHTDHWNPRTLATLRAQAYSLVLPRGTSRRLMTGCRSGLFSQLETAGLLRGYHDATMLLVGGFECWPFAVRHDSGATFGFRICKTAASAAAGWSLGYAADLGCWDEPLADVLADVDLLALEFNHDVVMQRRSGRHPNLIARVLGDEGHLSNQQAAALLREILRRSTTGRLRQLVQLHLSRQCNRPDLALAAAYDVIDTLGVDLPVHAARQDMPSPVFEWSAGTSSGGDSRRIFVLSGRQLARRRFTIAGGSRRYCVTFRAIDQAQGGDGTPPGGHIQLTDA